MSAVPAVVETTPVSNDLATDVLVDRFLSRVAALTPAQWGALDAIGQREGARDPVSRWKRARRQLAIVDAPVLRDALAIVGTIGGYAIDAADAVEWALSDAIWGRGAWRRRASARLASGAAPAIPLNDDVLPSARFEWETRRLTEIALRQPRGPGDAAGPLALALVALRMLGRRNVRAFKEMYGSVESVIPAASLGIG